MPLFGGQHAQGTERGGSKFIKDYMQVTSFTVLSPFFHCPFAVLSSSCHCPFYRFSLSFLPPFTVLFTALHCPFHRLSMSFSPPFTVLSTAFHRCSAAAVDTGRQKLQGRAGASKDCARMRRQPQRPGSVRRHPGSAVFSLTFRCLLMLFHDLFTAFHCLSLTLPLPFRRPRTSSSTCWGWG